MLLLFAPILLIFFCRFFLLRFAFLSISLARFNPTIIMEAIMFISFQIIFPPRILMKVMIFRSLLRGIFSHVTYLDQSSARKNISWILSSDICPWASFVSQSSQLSSATLEHLCAPNGGYYVFIYFHTLHEKTYIRYSCSPVPGHHYPL